jgi:hypothetical protein
MAGGTPPAHFLELALCVDPRWGNGRVNARPSSLGLAVRALRSLPVEPGRQAPEKCCGLADCTTQVNTSGMRPDAATPDSEFFLLRMCRISTHSLRYLSAAGRSRRAARECGLAPSSQPDEGDSV